MRALTCLLTMLAFLSSQTFAQSVIVQDADVNREQYKAYVLAIPGQITPSQAELKRRPTKEHREILVARLTEAQRVFLEKSPEEAISAFRFLLELKGEDDWSQEDRQAFLFAHLRIAQLNNDENLRQAELRESLSLGEDVRPDADLIPPPIIKAWQQVKSRTTKITVASQQWQNRYHLALLNGVRWNIEDNPEIKIYPGQYRLTLLSDSREPLTRNLAAEDINDLDAKSKLLASKPIAKPTVIDLKPASPANDLGLQLTERVERQSRPFYRSPWFWAGVGAVVVGVIIAQQNQNKEESSSEPTTTHGF